MVELVPTQRRLLIQAAGSRAPVDQDLRQRRSVALFRGVHVDARMATDFMTRCRGALETQNGVAVLGHRSSAVALSLRWVPPRWSLPDSDIDVAVQPGHTTRRRPGIRLWERHVPSDERVSVDGLPCMSACRTLVELARTPQMPPLLVVQLIDGALRDERVSVPELLACLARLPRHSGVARARTLVLRAREGVDSPQETRLRLTLEDGGVSGLTTNIRIEEDGRLLARSELGDPRLLLWGEYDGFDVHSEESTFMADRPRQRWLEGRGWKLLRYASRDYANPSGMVRDWLRASAEAPARIAALPGTRSAEVAAARVLLGLD